MAFALKTSSTAHALSHARRRALYPAVAVAAPGRLVVRAVAAAAPAPASFDQAVAVPRAPPRVPAAFVPVSDRPLLESGATPTAQAVGIGLCRRPRRHSIRRHTRPDRRHMSLSVGQTLSKIKEQGKTAFIPYITAGDPDLATTAEALRLLDACGADVIELGMPFSDPYADGSVIQASAARALAGGTKIDAVLSMLKEVTPELFCPVVLVSYLGPIVRRGPASFMVAVKQAGVQGLIVSDLSYAETCPFRNEAIKNNLDLVLLTTPATPAERMKKITKASEGFVYLVSINGVTGPRATVNSRVKDLLKEVKQVTDKPVAVGFGISAPDHVRQIAEWGADAVIIGSAMVQLLGEAASPREGLKRLQEYATGLKDALQ